MKLLIVTQTVDTNDPVLGFFHRWLEEFSKHFEQIEVICLKEGVHALPANVHVYSLGKEKKTESAVVYAFRFLGLVWKLRHSYDRVLVHMNQEYILIAGIFWKLLGKRIYLWRNHYAGSWLTDVAAVLCTKVFCTSLHSYTAKYKKTIRMPVGVDTTLFTNDDSIRRVPRSILFLGRITPAKRPDMFIRALSLLHKDNVSFTASIVGSPLPKDEAYLASLKELVHREGLRDFVSFLPALPNIETPDLYRAHSVFVNTSPSGMFDKTIFEALASGCTVLASSDDFAKEVGDEYHFSSSEELAKRLARVLPETNYTQFYDVLIKNSLKMLGAEIGRALQK